MFDSLSEKLQGTLAGVRQRGALTEADITRAMREIRLALLEADVNFKVVKQFTATVKERCLGMEVQRQLNPGQQVVKIVNEELTNLMGGASAGLSFSPRPPTVVLMAGLQGSGKTTATAKLAKHLHERRGSSVDVAEQFAEVAQFDGVVLSKLDGDARGGAALSVKAVTGKAIMFASTGEKLGDFERFHPDRMAQRILGMGDVLSFIEKAEQSVDEQEAKALERKLRKNQFTLEDFLGQLKRIRKMGPLTSLLGMIPGFAGHQLSKLQVDEKELDRVEAIVLSMTPYERRHPELIKGSRRLRIAKGSGTTVQQVNQLVKQFEQMRKLMRGIQQGRMPDLGQLMRQAR